MSKKRRKSLRLVMEQGPADGLEVLILAPLEVKICPPEEVQVKPEHYQRAVTYRLTRLEGETLRHKKRAVYRPKKGIN